MPEMLRSIKGVEIFRTGRWKNELYGIVDLDEMVQNFHLVGFKPPVKLGHAEPSGAPAFGWVERIYRAGDRLLADIDVVTAVYNQIKSRMFDTVSSEIYHDVERGGRRFRRVLKGLALLGAEVPAVSGLAPLRVAVHSLPRHAYQRAVTCNMRFETMTTDNPSAELDRRVRERMDLHRLDYPTAFHEVLAADPALARAYGACDAAHAFADDTPPRTYSQTEVEGAGEKIHRLVLAKIDAGCKGYGQAFREVIAENPDLAQRYGGIAS